MKKCLFYGQAEHFDPMFSFLNGKITPNMTAYEEKHCKNCKMLSSVTLDCQVTMIVMNSGSQLSEL